jgi:hypothetical protein
MSQNKCSHCGKDYTSADISLVELANLLNERVPYLISNTLYMIPMIICLGMLNVFNIITWHVIRLPIMKNGTFKQQLIAHIICVILPIIIGYIDSESSGIYNLYISGIFIITSNVLNLLNTIILAVLFVLANLLFIFLIGIDIGSAFMITKRLFDHVKSLKLKLQ